MVLGYVSCFCQQNDFFRKAKETYDGYENRINSEFNRRMMSLSAEEAYLLKSEYLAALIEIEDNRTKAYVEALVKTKINEDLIEYKNPKNSTFKDSKDYVLNVERRESAEYPTGFLGLRAEVMNLFNTNLIYANTGVITTLVTFIVEKDGSVTNVKARGENIEFNKQAEIAIYLLSEKFKPARVKGNPVRSKFRFPIKMKF